MYDIEMYQTANGSIPLMKFLKETRKKYGVADLARIKLFVDLLKEYGMKINNFCPHAIRQIDGDLYELRPGDNRVFFFFYKERRFVLLHGFRKKQQQTPIYEIETARKRMDDYVRRNSKWSM